MSRKDVVVHEEEEEDLGTAMQKMTIPLAELNQLPNDSVYNLVDGVRKIIEDPNLLFEDSREFGNLHQDDKSVEDSKDSKQLENSTKPPTASRGRFSVPPKRSRNKRGRPKGQCLKSSATVVDSNFVNITDKSCTHCGTRNTPMWREGPRGPRTLCNACGVRYRTGRLYPEYRPASSPEFKPNVYSNFHRKVMEIRRERHSPPAE
ncbi:PREDICTED: GATA transcription factor 14-like [Camelina sativa]|uniref:GATA transcription factor 14-like n=1 Tax=Camelina sativa TaxID=90675 RepID=A0ABM0ZF30_CAMSA|nr:PREDICTED: GATA transcription factor 14-like [Camelina sativa]